MNKRILPFALVVLLASCQTKQQNPQLQISTIDSTLQAKTTSLLIDKMQAIQATSGQVILMEVQTGKIKARVNLEKSGEEYQTNNHFSKAHETGLAPAVSLLAALESGKISLNDTVDVGDGIYAVHDRVLVDHNYHRGGYGKITFKKGLAVSSNISIYKAMEKAFGNNADAYFQILNQMGYGKPDSLADQPHLKPAVFVTPHTYGWSPTAFAWFCIGYNQKINPLQTLTFFNAIANNGKMVQPQLYESDTVILVPQIANPTSLKALKEAMEYTVKEGLGKCAYSKMVPIAGNSGTAQTVEGGYHVQFCGYFPTQAPRYSMIITMYKEGLPASGGLMAGSLFKQIVENCVYDTESLQK